jgi:hypothetical protein
VILILQTGFSASCHRNQNMYLLGRGGASVAFSLGRGCHSVAQLMASPPIPMKTSTCTHWEKGAILLLSSRLLRRFHVAQLSCPMCNCQMHKSSIMFKPAGPAADPQAKLHCMMCHLVVVPFLAQGIQSHRYEAPYHLRTRQWGHHARSQLSRAASSPNSTCSWSSLTSVHTPSVPAAAHANGPRG